MSKSKLGFTDLFDYSRASIASYIDPLTSAITSVAIDEPRFISSGLMLEQSATNLLLNSDAPTTQTVTVTSGTPYTLTSFGTGAGYAFVSDGGSGTAPIGNPITFTPPGTTVEISVSGTLAGYQLEIGEQSTSFVLTDGATATRSPDLLSRTLGTEYSDQTGTFYIEFTHVHNDDLGTNILLSNGSTRQFVYSTETDEYIAGNGTITRDFPSVAPSGNEKLALSIQDGEWILARNGTATTFSVTSDTILDITTLEFFEVGNGVLAYFEYWPLNKTSAELEAMTA